MTFFLFLYIFVCENMSRHVHRSQKQDAGRDMVNAEDVHDFYYFSGSWCGENVTQKDHGMQKRRKLYKPLVDLSEFETLFVSPLSKPLVFLLPSPLTGGAATCEDYLDLVVTDESQASDVGPQQHNVPRQESYADGGHGHSHAHIDRQGCAHGGGSLALSSCEQKLSDCKLKIMASRLHYSEDVWSLAAQVVNPYEILPSVAVGVLNRAFFKMWELIQVCPGLVPLVAEKPNLLSAHLCEGPGGFVQAVLMHRLQSAKVEESPRLGSPSSVTEYGCGSTFGNKGGDLWFAVTLNTESQNGTLKMRMTKLEALMSEFVKGYVHYGSDQSGDITNPDNVSSFVEFVLQKSNGEKMHLVTGDGAFDVSDDFSLQEQSHCHLFFCEMVTALRLQCSGGALVMKFFDCFTEETLVILHLIASLYTRVEIVRLRTSRVCNSERYLVAQGFNSLPGELEHKLMDICGTWYHAVQRGASARITISRPIATSFLDSLNQCNTAIASGQIVSILRAVTVSEQLGERLSNTNSVQHKAIVSILRRKLRRLEKLRANAVSLCEALCIPLEVSRA